MRKNNPYEKVLKDLRLGIYKVLILKLLREKRPMHGYMIRKTIIELSSNMLEPSESTIYDALKRLEKLNLIKSYWATSPLGGPMRKYYTVNKEKIGLIDEIIREACRTLDLLRKLLQKGVKENEH